MKRFRILLCGLLLTALLPSVASARKPEPAPEGQACLTIESSVHDFGQVPRRGGDLVHEFTYRNTGTAPLVLLRVFSSCSCLRASYSKRPVAPGATGTIRLVYEPHKSEPGAFHKVVQVISNSSEGRVLLTVQGNSVENAKKR